MPKKATSKTLLQGEPPLTPGKRLLDDWWLDASHEAMLDMARVCEKQIGRKPELEDFRQLLEVRLGVSAEDYFSDGAELEVVEVIFKTKKRPRAQSYKEGDVFAIALGDGRYSFGRVMKCRDRWGELIEVFRATSKDKRFRPSIIESGRLIYPTLVNPLRCFKNRRWLIVASDDRYSFPKMDENLEFTAPKPPGWVAEKPFAPKPTSRPIDDDEWQRMEANGQSNALRGPEDVEEQIRKALQQAQ